MGSEIIQAQQEHWPIDTMVRLCGRHPWAGHLGVISRYERVKDMPRWGLFPVVLLVDRATPREVFVLRPRQMRRFEGT